jgi:hypothetical protein
LSASGLFSFLLSSHEAEEVVIYVFYGVARYARGNIDEAMEVLSIMAMRAPPEVRRK